MVFSFGILVFGFQSFVFLLALVLVLVFGFSFSIVLLLLFCYTMLLGSEFNCLCLIWTQIYTFLAHACASVCARAISYIRVSSDFGHFDNTGKIQAI